MIDNTTLLSVLLWVSPFLSAYILNEIFLSISAHKNINGKVKQ